VASKNILFIHQNFPGQFPHIADALVAQGHKVMAIGGETAKDRAGVKVRRWKLKRGSTKGIFEPATRAEADLLRAAAAADVAWETKAKGFMPDLIIGHPGWGETIHMSEVFPGVPQILFGEFFYKSHGADVAFDLEYETSTPALDMQVHAKNLGLAMAYSEAEVIVCPTPFQARTLPIGLQSRVRVLHEGVDIGSASRKANARFTLPNGQILDGSQPVITFINRNFERLRGFHIFMRALPALLDRCPDAQVVLIGRDSGKGYGAGLPDGKTWKGLMMDELGDRLDVRRVHFVGPVPHANMISALSISWGHVYYTYPFVLSWSLVEAMACECLILGSDTGPVRDAITSGVNGVLNDFFDVDALSKAMIQACERPRDFDVLRPAARETALRLFDRQTVGVPGWMQLIDELLSRS
jgi:glycosyltransferase involved in cell wall biosynthesis